MTRTSATPPTHVPRQPRQPRQPFGRYAATAGGVALLVVAIGLVLVATRWSSLPTVVASHWGRDGVDGTQGRTAYVVTMAVVVVGPTLLLGGLAALLPAEARRILAAATGWAAGFVGVIGFGSLLAQSADTDPYARTMPAWVWVTAVLLGVVLAVGLWLLNPPPPAVLRAPGEQLTPDATLLPRPDGDAPTEQVAWFGTATPSRPVTAVLVVVLVAAALVAWLASPWTALVPVVIGLALVVALHATVVVDAGGVRVTSAGVDWLRVPLEQVRQADHREIRPLREFGGYGMRYRKDRRGYVVRPGDALELRQADGTTTYVTTDGAGEAAAVVNTLLTRLPR